LKRGVNQGQISIESNPWVKQKLRFCNR